MHEDPLKLLRSFEPKGILLDANLLVVYIVALVDPQRVGKAKRTEAFQPDDARFLLATLPRYASLFTTPGVLVESFNLLGGFFKSLDRAVAAELTIEIRGKLEIFNEIHVPAKHACQDDAFLRLGLTDVSIAAALAGDRFIVLTADAPLAHLLEKRQLPCVNYNHIRF